MKRLTLGTSPGACTCGGEGKRWQVHRNTTPGDGSQPPLSSRGCGFQRNVLFIASVYWRLARLGLMVVVWPPDFTVRGFGQCVWDWGKSFSGQFFLPMRDLECFCYGRNTHIFRLGSAGMPWGQSLFNNPLIIKRNVEHSNRIHV